MTTTGPASSIGPAPRRSVRAISPADETRLVECVQYLNLSEMKAFCRRHDLPLHIHLERPDGSLRRTGDRDRKDVVLTRILDYALHGRRGGPTIYVRSVVASGPLPAPLTPRTRIRYGQYEKHNPHFVETMEALTDGGFRTGLEARAGRASTGGPGPVGRVPGRSGVSLQESAICRLGAAVANDAG